jgi:isohexenylglutaconyl-CoA hydratase
MNELPATRSLLVEPTGSWLTVWFNRPANRNALTDEVLSDLLTVTAALEKNTEVRGVVFRGKGGVFCAGGDLKGFDRIATEGESAHELASQISRNVALGLSSIRNLPQLTVAAVEGAAMAGGFGIACACDLIVTTGDARFALTETRIGLTPAQIAPYVIERLGFANARRSMLLGSQFDGRRAHEIGMADFLAENTDGLEACLDEVRRQVLRCAPGAVAATKQIIAASQSLPHEQFVDAAAAIFTQCLLGDEGREGFRSFIEKRKPSWAP